MRFPQTDLKERKQEPHQACKAANGCAPKDLQYAASGKPAGSVLAND
jgi:hypothetical protein